MTLDRNSYWPERLYQLIAESPGISMTDLTRRTRKLTKQERRDYIDRLLDDNRIWWNPVESDRGHASWCFWPKQPAADSVPATPADEMKQALELVKQQIESGQSQFALAAHNVNEALKLVSQLQVTPASLPASAVETPTAGEGELRGAG
jgi:hypothetical protein